MMASEKTPESPVAVKALAEINTVIKAQYNPDGSLKSRENGFIADGLMTARSILSALLSPAQEAPVPAGDMEKAVELASPIEALHSLGFGGDVTDEKIGWRGTYPQPTSPEHFRCEFCDAEHLDCTEIPHASACPVRLCRAVFVGLAEAR